MADASLNNYMRHVWSMRQITNAEIVNTYWGQASAIAKTGKLAFVLQGNVSWESQEAQGVTDRSGSIWLKSNRYEPIGKHFAEEPVRTYLQWYMATYEIWGTVAVDIDPKDALASKPLIEEALRKATCVSDTLCLLCDGSLRFLPARYQYVRNEPLPSPPEQVITESWECMPLRLQEELTSASFGDDFITKTLFPLVGEVEGMPTAVKTVIKTAIDWHAQANRYVSGLNRFVNYWVAIELLGNFFYPRLPADVVKRKTKGQKKDDIMSQLKAATRNNCMGVIDSCKEISRPSARTKIRGFLGAIVDEATDRESVEDELFQADRKTGKSLYQIRNDIAHGEISEHQLEEVGLIDPLLYKARSISRKIILHSINCAGKLGKLIK